MKAVWPAAVAVVMGTSGAKAQTLFDAPLFAQPAHRQADQLVAAARMGPDPRIKRSSLGRRSALKRAKSAALARLHQSADEALSKLGVAPPRAAAAHAAIDRAAKVQAQRLLPDGSATVSVAVAEHAILHAAGVEQLRWAAP